MQEITLADLFHLPSGHILSTAGKLPEVLVNEKRPNVARYEIHQQVHELKDILLILKIV